MNRNHSNCFSLPTLLGILFTIILGTLLHFTYDWSDRNTLVGLFSAVDESTFEHLKLLLTPFFIYTFIEKAVFSPQSRNYYISKFVGVLCGIILIPILFYSYTALLGRNYLLIDILIFIISVIVSFCVSNTIQKNHLLTKYERMGFLLLNALIILFGCITLIKLA